MNEGKEGAGSLFQNEEYAKVVKLYDGKGGIDEILDDPLGVEYYVMSCYYTKRPRKISSSLKKIVTNGGSENSIFLTLAKTSMKEGRHDVLNSIRKITSGLEEINASVESCVVDGILREGYRPPKFSTKMMSDMITRLLNRGAFYQVESSERTLESLRLRTKKLFRNKEFERVIEWMGRVHPRDENFESYNILLLSYRAIGEVEKCTLLAKESVLKINISRHFDSVLDILYTVGDNEGIMRTIDDFGKENVSFKGNFILARALRRMGDRVGAERIISDAKKTLVESIDNGSMGVSESISNIKEIGFSGDVETSEHLLYDLISKGGAAKKILDEGRGFEIIDLFRDTLDRQKRIRLRDALVVSRLLIKNKRFEESLRVLNPYILHGISDSADLLELYLVSANGVSRNDIVMDLIKQTANSWEASTIDRIAHSLEVNGMFREHTELCYLVSNSYSDSFKFLRSYFNVVEKYSGSMPPKEMLIRMSKKAKPDADSVVYFIERYSRISNPSDIFPLVKTLRIDRLTRIYCSMRVIRFGSQFEMSDVTEELMALEKREVKKKNFRRMIEEYVNICHSNNQDEEVIAIIDHFGLGKEFDRKITSSRIRSLIVLGFYGQVEELLESYQDDFSKIERWRYLIEIGNLETAKNEMRLFQDREGSLQTSELASLKSIYFKLGMFSEYLEITTEGILKGEFNLPELTRHFFSLYKMGEDALCLGHHKTIRDLYCHSAKKRAIIATAGYDFGLSEDYLDELNLAIIMDPNSVKIPLFISKSFLALDRPDIAFHFIRKALIIGQRDRDVIETGRKIQKMMNDFQIDPREINEEQIISEPIFTDVEVIRKLKEMTKSRVKSNKRRKVRKRIAIHSHTLDIGGAERQASLLLELLGNGEVKNSGFSLITHRVPNKSNIQNSYYRNLPVKDLDIIEYIKPGSNNLVSGEAARIIGHLSNLKARRLMNLVQIYSEGKYDVAHTWQDYCNIYGGIAALISGVSRIVMSARTLPPSQKGRLAARQGRSYRECYRLLLESKEVLLTHNSDFGKREYIKWLDVPENKNLTVHNGLDVSKWIMKTKNEFDLKSEIGIKQDCMMIGYVGRFTTDKRPWLFLKVAERILGATNDSESLELSEWFSDNEEGDRELLSEEIVWDNSKEVHFVMVGDGPQFEKSREIVQNSEILRGRIHLVGFSEKVGEYLRNFDCFLLTSRVEGLPNVIIEAQACGVPVVSTNAGGSRECIIEGETGIIAYDDSPSEISKLLNEVLSNKEYTKIAKKKGVKFVKKKFGYKAYSKNVNKLYSGV